MRATSLNRRDVGILKGFYPIGDRTELIPLSDGAGEVVAIGSGVTRVAVGDHVAATFFQTWIDGRPAAATGASALGGALDGMLAEYLVLHERGLVVLPSAMSFEAAATLPCAGVTAWNGLVTQGRLAAGDTVLLQGTGGVAIFGLQIAVAAGAKAVITSGSDAKLERARAMGAAATVNYRTTPDWEQAVIAATGGRGADQVLELGGAGTLAKSLAAAAPGGHLALIGGLAGFGGNLGALPLIARSLTASGIRVGSRANFEALLAFVGRHRIEPVIDRVFAFGEAAEAYAYMDAGSHFGKVVIRH